jgi:hypothetical protein
MLVVKCALGLVSPPFVQEAHLKPRRGSNWDWDAIQFEYVKATETV